MSVVDTLERMLSSNSIKVATRGLRYGLDTTILPRLGVYLDGVYHDSDNLVDLVEGGWKDEGELGGADVVVLGTCELE